MTSLYLVCMAAETAGCFLVSPVFLVLMAVHSAAYFWERKMSG